jgi:hypothetical protein
MNTLESTAEALEQADFDGTVVELDVDTSLDGLRQQAIPFALGWVTNVEYALVDIDHVEKTLRFEPLATFSND